ARFVIQATPPAVSQIGLVALDFVVIWDSLCTDLHAGVGALAVHLELQFQLKIAERFARAEEFIPFDWLRARTADNRVIFDPKHLEISLPPGKRFAVEDG